MQHPSVLEHRLNALRRWLGALLAAGACAIAAPPIGQAAQVTFRWDYTASGAAGFMLYCGVVEGKYTAIVDVGNTDSYTVSGLSPGDIYQCAVTAYDAARTQSDYSAPIRIYVAAAGQCVRACDGDLNHDGQINALDIGALKNYWGSSDAYTDLNGDGMVNVLDLAIFRLLYR